MADALQSKGIPAIVIEDPRATPSGYASWEATVGGSVTAFGSRPSLVLVPPAQRLAAIEAVHAFRPHAFPSVAQSTVDGSIEGVGIQLTRRHRLLAFLVLVPTVIAVLAAAVRALRQLLR